eukprot:gnl/TRDRNA2_/TRDRNA2_64807_c0_seq1.p2 gnl/TRDRNA2_/TRDRNA2_64807_c0~~gnl/TRDRNA2_/TRDRNA2_64807_c0_seq1.p2  ORF type:complete len:180 (-),score=19.03 gnl/TRDRNA2_/TRDRNA2_64807_c0_seq1:137-676(-)
MIIIDAITIPTKGAQRYIGPKCFLFTGVRSPTCTQSAERAPRFKPHIRECATARAYGDAILDAPNIPASSSGQHHCPRSAGTEMHASRNGVHAKPPAGVASCWPQELPDDPSFCSLPHSDCCGSFAVLKRPEAANTTTMPAAAPPAAMPRLPAQPTSPVVDCLPNSAINSVSKNFACEM